MIKTAVGLSVGFATNPLLQALGVPSCSGEDLQSCARIAKDKGGEAANTGGGT